VVLKGRVERVERVGRVGRVGKVRKLVDIRQNNFIKS
jgi:hypothetical protein